MGVTAYLQGYLPIILGSYMMMRGRFTRWMGIIPILMVCMPIVTGMHPHIVGILSFGKGMLAHTMGTLPSSKVTQETRSDNLPTPRGGLPSYMASAP